MREAERRIAKFRADTDALDRPMRLFDPAASPLASAPVRPAVRSGEFSRTVLDALRDASAPMTARDVAAKAASTLGLDVSTARAMQRVIGQVRNALARTRSGVASEKVRDVIRWRIE